MSHHVTALKYRLCLSLCDAETLLEIRIAARDAVNPSTQLNWLVIELLVDYSAS